MACIPICPNSCCEHQTTAPPGARPVGRPLSNGERTSGRLGRAATRGSGICSSLFWRGRSGEYALISYGSQSPHLPRKPLPTQGDACGSEDIQEQDLASPTVYTMFQARPRRKQSSENQDFLPCPETILAMPNSPHCFNILPSTPRQGIPTARNETPEKLAGRPGALQGEI